MVTRLEQNRWMLANGSCSLHADIIYTLQFGCRSPKQVLRCWLRCRSPKQVLRYWLCSSLLASLSITKTSFALELTHVDAENSFIDWPARARPAAALRPVLPGSQPRARELVPRPEYGRLAVAVANELQHNS